MYDHRENEMGKAHVVWKTWTKIVLKLARHKVKQHYILKYITKYQSYPTLNC